MKYIFLFCVILSNFIKTLGMETPLLSVKNENTEIKIVRTFSKGCEIVKKNIGDPCGLAFNYFFKDGYPVQTLVLSADNKILFLVRSRYMEVICLSAKTYQEMVKKKAQKKGLNIKWGIVKRSFVYEFFSPIKVIIQDEDGVIIHEESGYKSICNF